MAVSHLTYPAGPGHTAVGNSLPLDIGRKGPLSGGYWLGKIDDVRIWTIARQGTDITAAYQSQLSGPRPGLVATWHFDPGSSLADSSGNLHDVTLHGGTAISLDVHP